MFFLCVVRYHVVFGNYRENPSSGSDAVDKSHIFSVAGERCRSLLSTDRARSRFLGELQSSTMNSRWIDAGKNNTTGIAAIC